jgi:hypothetical protein
MFIDSLIADSWVCWLADSLIRLFGIPCFIDPLGHWLIASLLHWFVGHYFIDLLIHRLSTSLLHWFIGSLLRCLIWLLDSLVVCFIVWFLASFLHRFTDSPIHWLTDSWVHWFIDSFSQLCMDCCMSCHWHFNNRLLIRWCISQLQHFVSSASQKLSYRLSSSYSCFISFETSAPARAGLPGNDMPMTPPAQYLPIKSHSCAVNRGLINTDCSLGCVPSQWR